MEKEFVGEEKEFQFLSHAPSINTASSTYCITYMLLKRHISLLDLL